VLMQNQKQLKHEVRLFLEQEMSHGELIDLPCGQSGVFSRKSPDKDGVNQDGAALLSLAEDQAVLIVADGMGGARAGEKAASTAIESVISTVLAAPAADDSSLRTAILDGFELANQRVCEMGIGAATTLVVVEICGSVIRSYHAGDSVVLIFGRGGKIKLQTLSHAPVAYAVESGLLEERAALDHDERNIVSNVIGSADMRIDIGPPVELAPNDTVIISSDGLFDNLEVTEIMELSRKGPLTEVIDQLVSECQKRMSKPQPSLPSKPDDLTFITFRPRGSNGNGG